MKTKKIKKELTREQRQIRYIPLVVAAIMVMVYGGIHLNSGEPFLQEPLFGQEYQFGLSRYFDILMVYLAMVILIVIKQDNRGIDLFEAFFCNVVLFFLVAVLSWMIGWSLLSSSIITLGIFWGLAYVNIKEIGVNFVMLFIILTFIFGFVNAFVISVAAIVPTGAGLYFKMLIKGSDFKKFLSWIGLGERQEGLERGLNKRRIIIDLSVGPEEIEGFKVEKHLIGPADFHFSQAECELYAPLIQKTETGAIGSDLISDPVIKERACSAVLLEWLVKNPQEIPRNWNGLCIPFWGTLYERNEKVYVRALTRAYNNCIVTTHCLDDYFYANSPALVFIFDPD